ncbi:hypothetical protein ACHAXR_007102, partial [Thalassiosira sp. AJA248-18]
MPTESTSAVVAEAAKGDVSADNKTTKKRKAPDSEEGSAVPSSPAKRSPHTGHHSSCTKCHEAHRKCVYPSEWQGDKPRCEGCIKRNMECIPYVRVSQKKAKKNTNSSDGKKEKTSAAKSAATTGEKEIIAKADRKKPISKGQACKLEGCDKYRQKSGYCIRHAKLANQLAPISASNRQKSLKPLLKAGSAIYAAYWPPEDKTRDSEPDWYPGVVSSYKVSQKPADDRYGYVRYYNVKYDDGDVLKNISEHFVFPAEEYLLHLRLDDENPGKKNPSWRGVRNVTDKKSKDQWAKMVGWYVAAIDGEKHPFSLLADALRAYDASVVRSKGVLKESELNLPEDW